MGRSTSWTKRGPARRATSGAGAASQRPLPGQAGGQHPLVAWTDQDETYGAHVVREFLELAAPFETLLDIGAGPGRDLSIARDISPGATLLAVEVKPTESLTLVTPNVFAVDIERAKLPFPDESVDVVVANQVLEHTKEIFWIFHEVTRVLKLGGHLIIGVPNVASLHNRGLLLFGEHPTQHKLYSAHVRVFSKRDTERFLDVCWPGGYEVLRFSGSQFYPFPKFIARRLARRFPAAAFSIFWLASKGRPYSSEFLRHPEAAQLETNFFVGDGATPLASTTDS